MNYRPTTQPPRGFNPNLNKLLSTICDVCSRPRNKGNHRSCSEVRKAAGFRYTTATPLDTKVSCKDCYQEFLQGQIMGNVCRKCYIKALDLGGDE